MEIALEMEQKPDSDEHAPNSLSAEYAYFDGMHSRVRGYKTLTLWVYHLGMCKVLLLAVMEMESENTEMVTLFFNFFNECLKEFTGDKSYNFLPNGLWLMRQVQILMLSKQCLAKRCWPTQLLANGTLRHVQSDSCPLYYKKIRTLSWR